VRLAGKRAIVTGASSGIGLAVAERFRQEGAQVLNLDLATGCDVSSEASVQQHMKEAIAQLGGLDALVTCAGIPTRARAGDQDTAGWDKVFAVNLRGTFLCAREALPALQASKGNMVLLSSIAGATGMRNRAAYGTGKAGIIGLTKSMALDYAADGVRVNCVCPGFVDTPLLSAIREDEARMEKLRVAHPLGRIGQPADIANAILFLASDEASWITGQALGVDGGFLAGYAVDM
jgi:NAD(P)-dependent dehydrogenase (short-subunit alcohol dehydrogenase family)